eukprot:755507-Rhodomonas_salina.1
MSLALASLLSRFPCLRVSLSLSDTFNPALPPLLPMHPINDDEKRRDLDNENKKRERTKQNKRG